MRHWTLHARSREYTVALALLTAILVLSILLFPERAFQSSLGGLTIWWNIVFPSLLPFLMVSELMNGFGATRAIGTLLEPLARLLFRIPGVGGWAIALGAAAGMPAGAEAAGRLRRDGLVSREEGERILAVSHVANPFFILTVIGAGFLHSAAAGAIIAVVHYGSALATGVLLRLLRRRGRESAAAGTNAKEIKRALVVRALAHMHKARLEDGRSFGKLLGDSVSGAIQTLMMIGGTMIVFSVLLGVLDTLGLGRLLAAAAALVLPDSVAPPVAVQGALAALLEQHIGANRIGELPVSEAATAALIGAALAWSGLAVHVQVITAIRQTDLRYRSFLVSRLTHAGLSVVLTFAAWDPLAALFDRAVPSFLGFASGNAAKANGSALSFWAGLADVPGRMAALGIALALAAALSVALSVVRRSATPG
ncbi:sporulation protein [Paenibacillus sp. GYB003]|uniref:sporulation protein n=1 Tax=Paenibacillus sp. GYB003 TaxID=2994392 RepID=UPI002F961206